MNYLLEFEWNVSADTFEADYERYKGELARQNVILADLAPELHKRLSERYGAELREWLMSGPFSGAKWSAGFEGTEKADLQPKIERLLNGFLDSGDMVLSPDGFDGWIPESVCDDEKKKELAAAIAKLLLDLPPDYAVFQVIVEIEAGELKGRDYHDAVFFIYGVGKTSGKSDSVMGLYLLDHGGYEHWGHLFQLNEEYLDPVWKEVEDLLPDEIKELPTCEDGESDEHRGELEENGD